MVTPISASIYLTITSISKSMYDKEVPHLFKYLLDAVIVIIILRAMPLLFALTKDDLI